MPLTAKVAALAGKYVFLNIGRDKGVKEGDNFVVGEEFKLFDPDSGKLITEEAYGIEGELYVEQVFDTYCTAVPTYSFRLGLFPIGTEVYEGPRHRVTPFLGIINKP